MSIHVDADQSFVALDGDGFRAPVGTTIADLEALDPIGTGDAGDLWDPYGGIEAGLTLAPTRERTPKSIWNKRGVYRVINGAETLKISFRAVEESAATLKTRHRGGGLVPVPPASGTTPTGIFKHSTNPTGDGEKFAFAMDIRDGLKHLRKYWPVVELDSDPQEVYDGENLVGYDFELLVLEHPVLVPAAWQNFDPTVVAG